MTVSTNEAVRGSWATGEVSARQIALEAELSAPVSFRELVDRLTSLESRVHAVDIHTDDDAAITGRAQLELRSDGSWVASGHMRATGVPSYDYGLSLWLRLPDGMYVTHVQSGSVHGTDTPGDRRHDFRTTGTEPSLALHWRQIRGGSLTLGFSMSAELSGVLGTAADVVDFLARGLVATALLGAGGWVLVLGHETADLGIGTDGQSVGGSLLVAAGQVLLAGPMGLVPVLVGGVAAGELVDLATDVEDRALRQEEIDFLRKIFADQIGYHRVRITNLSQRGENGPRAFVVPGRGGSILVNMGEDAWQQPLTHTKLHYPSAGQLFVHELTHAWQLTQRPLLAVVFDVSDTYPYTPGDSPRRLVETAWQRKRWGDFNNEQQAHIVDDWYASQAARVPPGTTAADVHRVVDLDGTAARDDPAFRFVRDHLRLGNP